MFDQFRFIQKDLESKLEVASEELRLEKNRNE